jgi:hypothetical protein
MKHDDDCRCVYPAFAVNMTPKHKAQTHHAMLLAMASKNMKKAVQEKTGN